MYATQPAGSVSGSESGVANSGVHQGIDGSAVGGYVSRFGARVMPTTESEQAQLQSPVQTIRSSASSSAFDVSLVGGDATSAETSVPRGAALLSDSAHLS